MNGLHNESSLYLQSHAEQPVHWIPWGSSVVSSSQHKLQLISIGYASCHWCHVMSRDIFSDDEVAAILNAHFTCFKVDREQHPDVDRAYMKAASTLLRGQVGWPLNVVALPDGRPIWASTYLAKAPWMFAMKELAKAAHDRPDELEAFAEELREMLISQPTPNAIQPKKFSEAYLELRDVEWGGMGIEPKFPNPNFLRLVARRINDSEDHIINTWKRIAHSGTYDQQLGGIMRYAVHRDWSVPHFEKMAYDQGYWLGFCAELYARLPEERALIERHVSHLTRWLHRDLQLNNGLFASSISAEINGEEGSNLLWSDEAIANVLKDDASEFLDRLKRQARRVQGKWHLHHDGIPDEQWLKHVGTLAQHAMNRPQPTRDDQCIGAWNASVITGLAEWCLVSNQSIEGVVQSAQIHMSTFFPKSQAYHLVYPDGSTSGTAFLDDLAMTMNMLIRMAQLTMDPTWLDQAEQWADWTVSNFEKDGVLHYQAQDSLFWEPVPWEDDIMPSPLGQMTLNLIELAHLKGRQDFHQLARDIAHQRPAALTHPQQCYTWHEVDHIIDMDEEHLLIRAGEARPALNQLTRIWGPSSELNAYGQLCTMTSCKFEYHNPNELNHG